MKKALLIISIFFIGGMFLVNAQDLIILRNGNIIEAKVTEISPSEIRYRRLNHLDGPVIVISRADVISIRYENGTVEIINTTQIVGQGRSQSSHQQTSEASFIPQLGEPTLLQQTLNLLPAIPIAGYNLKFVFGGETWIARLNGRDFLAGTFMSENTSEGSIITLKQTHTYPPRTIPGINWIRTPGPDIVLEYKIGPPASLSLISRSQSEFVKYDTGKDAWKNKSVYLGGGFGFARSTWSYDYWDMTEYSDSERMIASSFIADFILHDFFSMGVSLYLGIGLDGNSDIPVLLYIPVLLKLGGKFGFVELTGNFGYTIAQGFTVGTTFGVKTGPGILFTEVLYIPWGAPPTGFVLDTVIYGSVGYKIGVGKGRK